MIDHAIKEVIINIQQVIQISRSKIAASITSDWISSEVSLIKERKKISYKILFCMHAVYKIKCLSVEI